MRPTAGTILIAAPTMADPSFRRGVIYLIEHDGTGSVGVLLGRVTQTPVHSIFPTWAQAMSKPRVVFAGGPVGTDSALCLGRRVAPGHPERPAGPLPAGIKAVAGDIAIIDLDIDPELAASWCPTLRVFVGYSGWSAGQLESELAAGDWTVAGALGGDVHTGPREDPWARVLRRQPYPATLRATEPLDARAN